MQSLPNVTIRKMKKILIFTGRILASIILFAVFVLSLFSLSPIYRFEGPVPFKGDMIYNPYADLDTATGWKRACLHTHTKVDKGINECPYYPDVVYSDYMSYGYGILGFSNHQALTPHPVDSSLYIAIYEHGYNLFKFHLNAFGAGKVEKFDHILPILLSQKQFMIDRLASQGDFVQFNHPDRTISVNRRVMEHLSGYRLIEGDSGFGESDNGSGVIGTKHSRPEDTRTTISATTTTTPRPTPESPEDAPGSTPPPHTGKM